MRGVHPLGLLLKKNPSTYTQTHTLCLVDLRFERPGRHELGDQNNALLSFARSLPGVVEADNVRMLEALQHSGLLFEALTLRLGQLAILYTGQGKREKKKEMGKKSPSVVMLKKLKEMFTQRRRRKEV